jgi:hypothetical protein
MKQVANFAGFLFGSFFDSEDGAKMFLRSEYLLTLNDLHGVISLLASWDFSFDLALNFGHFKHS